jgi:hypothetical protein
MRGRSAFVTSLAAIGLGLLLGPAAQGRLIDFNNADPTTGDLATNFRQSSSPNVYSANATDGISGSGSVRGATNTATMVLNNGDLFNFAAPDASVTVSSYVRLASPTATGGSTLDLGLVQNQFGAFNGASNAPWVMVHLTPTSTTSGFTLTSSSDRLAAIDSSAAHGSATLNSGSFYKLVTTFTHPGSTDQVVVDATLYNSDFNGNVGTPVLSFTGDTYTNALITTGGTAAGAHYDGTQSRPAFQAVASQGAFTIDNFEYVPEPGAVGVMAVVAGAGLLRRRRFGARRAIR